MNRKSIGAALVVGLMAAACSGADATQPPPDTDAPTTEAETVVEVTAVDFGFEGLPETIPAGSTLTLVNESPIELHELVAVRLPADEGRTVEELLENPEDLATYFASVATVIIASPGEGGGMVVEGTGRLDEPGRYAIVCAIPTGADPGEYIEAAAEAEGGPPDVAGGPPHFVHGMFADVTVEG